MNAECKMKNGRVEKTKRPRDEEAESERCEGGKV
jgi:hypothetical protein